MSKIDEKTEKEIAEQVYFRTLVYVYLCQHPESTKANIAERLEISPITMSRAIAAGKDGVDESLVAGALELMGELDFTDFTEKLSAIQEIEDQRRRHERITQLKKIVAHRLKCDLFDFTDTGIMAFSIDDKNGNKKYFDEIPGDSEKESYQSIRSRIVSSFNMIARLPGNGEVFLFYYNHKSFSVLCDEMSSQKYDFSHKLTVVQVDVEKGRVVSEFILHDPKRRLAPIQGLQHWLSTKN